MMVAWSNLKFDESKITLQQVSDVVVELLSTTARRPSDEVTRYLANKIETYLVQLAHEQITQEEFESYMIDLQDIIALHSLKEDVEQKALLQKTMEIVSKLLLKGAVSVMT